MGRIVATMKVNRFTLVHPLRQARIRWQIVPVPNHHRCTNLGLESGTRHGAVIAINFGGIGIGCTINNDLITSLFTLGIPSNLITSTVIRLIGSSHIPIVKLWRDTVIVDLGGIEIIV